MLKVIAFIILYIIYKDTKSVTITIKKINRPVGSRTVYADFSINLNVLG